MRWMIGASQEPPTTDDFWGPSGKGCPLQPQKHGRSCRTSSTLQHHSPGGGPGDCDLQLHCRLAQVDSWLGRLGTRHDDDEAFRRGERWAGWGSIPVFFSPGWQVTRVSPCVRGPFPSKEIRPISERDDPGPPVVPGGQGIGLGSRTLARAGR